MKLIHSDERLNELLLANAPIEVAAYLLAIPREEISDFMLLSQGMTNHSYRFSADDRQYILRMPGAGTTELLSRPQEGAVYQAIAPLHISEEVVAFDCSTGIKLSVFMEDCRTISPDSWEDITLCMDVLYFLHHSNAHVAHVFDLRERLGFYSRLCLHSGAALPEHYTYDINVIYGLLTHVEAMQIPQTICHIDTVPGNFLVRPNGIMHLIDWEYSAMADPLTDVAMFLLRSSYSYEDSVRILNFYLGRSSTEEELFRLFTLMSAGSLLWTLWSAYKTAQGEDFTEYGAGMYQRYQTYVQFAKMLSPVYGDAAAGI